MSSEVTATTMLIPVLEVVNNLRSGNVASCHEAEEANGEDERVLCDPELAHRLPVGDGVDYGRGHEGQGRGAHRADQRDEEVQLGNDGGQGDWKKGNTGQI